MICFTATPPALQRQVGGKRPELSLEHRHLKSDTGPCLRIDTSSTDKLMALPELIEISPPSRPVQALVTVPGSKSLTNRALILAALGGGETRLRGALWSEDTQVMIECLQELGFMINVETDPAEICNRLITVYGRSGVVPPGGTEQRPLELYIANAGTAARFLAAFVCLGKGVYRLHGTPRMHQRPQAELFRALRQLGYRVDSNNDRLPALIHGRGPQPGRCAVGVAESSQFASALLLSAGAGGWQVEVEGESEEELPYVVMTTKLLEVFPRQGGEFWIEPDASSGSYFWAAGKLLELSGRHQAQDGDSQGPPAVAEKRRIGGIRVAHWPNSGWQVDERFPEFLASSGAAGSPGQLFTRQSISRRTDLADSIMTAIVLAPFSPVCVRFNDLGRLRMQECERVAALRTELGKCGATVVEEGDSLTVAPSPLHAAEIDSYDDHRMAMCFAILGLKIPGIRIRNPSCVKKTFPDFFQKLAAAPPAGLGTSIKDASGRQLPNAGLLAD
jgi:3-phosphoshikimate 1-carboxyvinyltransferase